MKALIALTLLLPAGASAQPCPSETDLGPSVQFLAIPAGCALPAGGFWYPPESHRKVLKRLAGLAELVKQERTAKEKVRAELETSRRAHLDSIRELQAEVKALAKSVSEAAEALKTCTEPPSRATWAGIGAGAGVIVCAGSVLLGSSL